MKGHCFKLISDGSTSKGLGMLFYHLNPSNSDIFYPMPGFVNQVVCDCKIF